MIMNNDIFFFNFFKNYILNNFKIMGGKMDSDIFMEENLLNRKLKITNRRKKTKLKWTKSMENRVKLNFDGTENNRDQSSYGFVIRDHKAIYHYD